MKTKTKYMIASIVLVLAIVLTIATLRVTAGETATYSYDIITKSLGDEITIVKSNDFNAEWIIESKNWFDNCKLKGSDISGMDCKEATYEDFIADRVKAITDGTLEQQAFGVISVYNMSRDIEILKEEVLLLKNELCLKDKTYSWCI